MLRLLVCMVCIFMFSQDGFAQTRKRKKVQTKPMTQQYNADESSAPATKPRYSSYGSSGYMFNARISPIYLLVGGVGLNFDYKINANWTVGPEVYYASYKLKLSSTDLTVTGYGFGARANWFQNGVYTDGWFVAPMAAYSAAKASGTDVNGVSVEATGSAFLVGAVGGYGWFWDNFNIMLGGGLALPIGDSKVEAKDSNGNRAEGKVTGSGVLIDFTLGYTF